MPSRLTLSLLAATCLLAGCNQPAVTPKPPAFQDSENTVRDWDQVATRIADGMAAQGYLPTPVQPGAVAPATPSPVFIQRPVFIRLQAPDSAFVRSVAESLRTEVLQRGGTLARTPAEATVVNLDVDFIRWGPRDKPPGLTGTLASALAVPGTVIGASLPMSTWTAADAAAFTAFGLGAFTDALVAMTPTMNAEAIWQASIVTPARVEMMLRAPIYIRAPDIPLYAKATSLTPMDSWSSTASLPARVIRYDP